LICKGKKKACLSASKDTFGITGVGAKVRVITGKTVAQASDFPYVLRRWTFKHKHRGKGVVARKKIWTQEVLSSEEKAPGQPPTREM